MGNSLRDQMLKAGLVDRQQVKKVKTEKQRKAKQLRNTKTPTVDENARRLRETLAAKAEHDRELNRQRVREAEANAIAAQIGQLIEQHRQPRPDRGVTYNFVDDKRIKRLLVSTAQLQQLAHGQLAIAKHKDKYELVPMTVAEKIRDRDETAVIPIDEPPRNQDQEDPYADYPIPDDLMW